MSSIFDALNRADAADEQEWLKRQNLYLPRVAANSAGLQPHMSRSQLPFANGLSDLMLENSQESDLPVPYTQSRANLMEESSRFNYGLDLSVNKRLIDVSGQLITNEKLRSMPQRSTPINAGTTSRLLPFKAKITALSNSLATEVKDNRFNVNDVSAVARYQIQNPAFDYRKQYNFAKANLTEDLYGLAPDYMPDSTP
jgi:hypothetical protein